MARKDKGKRGVFIADDTDSSLSSASMELIPYNPDDESLFLAMSADSLLSLQSVITSVIKWWWDNGASLNVVNQLSYLSSPQCLSSPNHIGGVGQGIVLTHKGTLPFLHGPGSTAYYSKDAKVCLLSLGLLQRTGGSYATLGLDKLIIRDFNGIVIDTAIVQPNGLSAVSPVLFSVLSLGLLSSPPMLVAPYSDSALVAFFRSSTPPICSNFTSGSCRFRAAYWFSHSVPSSPDPICLVCTPVYITANICKQLDRAEGLHQGVGFHRSDDDL